jgi:hypothetical protein
MTHPTRRFQFAAVAVVVSLAGPKRTWAQDPFEIQVYEYATVPRGRWDLETHVNFTARGIHEFDAGVAPSERQTHLTFELTRGITNYFELAGYLVTARRQGADAEIAGWRVRPRFRLPEDWLPFKFSLSTEFGFPKRIYEENSVTFELRPILERSFGRLQIDLNPVLGKAIRGPTSSEFWDFEPGARFGYTANKTVDLSVEYYGATGPLTHVEPAAQQMHQLFPGADINFSPDVVLNVGVGFGLTSAGNTLVYKTRLGWIF